jgi:purine-cytosine permease-like protein
LSIYTSGKGLSVLNIYLVVMLYFLVPWTAVNLTDYFFVRKGRYAIPHFFMPRGSVYGTPSHAEVGLAEGWETRQRTHQPKRKMHHA